MESPEEVNRWIFQQRDAFRRFFATTPHADKPHISQLINHPGISYEGADKVQSAYVGNRHYRKSSSIQLQFKVNGKLEFVKIAAPDDKGFFMINGAHYTAPIQRLVWSTDPLRIEYRRIDQVLLDGWGRRCDEEDNRSGKVKSGVKETRDTASKNLVSRRALAEKKLNPDVVFARLCLYLNSILTPTLNPRRHPDGLLHIFDYHNKWGALARQTQVNTFSVPLRDGEEWKCGITPYRRIQLSSMLGKDAREPDAGLDVFHTPEGDKIGLTRHLTRGTFVGDDRKLQPGIDSALGLLSSCVPFAQHNDGRRILMACGMMSRAVPVVDAVPPDCQTNFEMLVREMPGLTEDLGASLSVGFLFWEGLNYEDAIVVSRSAAEKLKTTTHRVVSIPVPCFCSVEKYVKKGKISKDDKLVDLIYSPLHLSLRMPVGLPVDLRRKVGYFPEELEWNDPGLRSPCSGFIEGVEVVELWNEDCPGATRFSKRLDFKIRVDRPLEIGDKLCNLHGNKGVVSAILPDIEMPRVDGKPLEILFNPIGIINRGNYGQILEALASQNGGSPVNSDVCDDPQIIVSAITKGDNESPIFSTVTYTRDGEEFKVRAVTGRNYILRLPQYASDSMNVYGEGIYSSITGQPPQGVGQTYGEMEVAALQAHGAHAILNEICEIRSHESGTAPQIALQDWLSALGFKLDRKGDEITILLEDLCKKPKKFTDLFSGKAKTKGDLECNADSRKDTRISLMMIRRRLSSELFFNDGGPIYIDLGREYPVDIGEIAIPFNVRYLPVLHPKYRPMPPVGGGMDDMTKRYAWVVRALWRSKQARNEEGDGVEKALKSLLLFIVGQLKDKHGIIRRVGLSRRLTYSSRFVIVPDPCLAVDQVSIPWDAVRVLFSRCLHGSQVESILEKSQQCLADSGVLYAPLVNAILMKEWVLLNRNPTLHKYNVMAFHPMVHFDSYALRLPPLVTPSFGADFDSDQMSVVPLFSEAAKKEADLLSFARNVVSVADGKPLLAPIKDFQLGLWLVCQDAPLLEALNEDLKQKDFPAFTLANTTDVDATFDRWIQDDMISGADKTNNVPSALLMVTEHACRALRKLTNQACFGSFDIMKAFWSPLFDSRAAKVKTFSEAGPGLIAGLSPAAMLSKGKESVEVLIQGKLAIGDFGGYRRSLYYQIRSQPGQGLAFDGDMRNALDAIGSITERATQMALSAKSGNRQLDFHEFKRLMKAAASGGDMDDTDNLANAIDFPRNVLDRHLIVLRKQLESDDHPNTFLQFLEKPFKVAPQGYTGAAADPRIALFLA